MVGPVLIIDSRLYEVIVCRWEPILIAVDNEEPETAVAVEIDYQEKDQGSDAEDHNSIILEIEKCDDSGQPEYSD